MEIFRSSSDALSARRRRGPLKGALTMPEYGSPLFTISRVVQACDDLLGPGRTWPPKTDRCCLWCTEPFPWVPVGVPRSYNERKDVFTLKWAYCSFNCAKAYMGEHGLKTDLLFYLAQRLFGGGPEVRTRLHGIREAPPRESLKKFGGPLDIDQFRGTPLVIRHGHPLDINVRCDPRLLTVAAQGDSTLEGMAQPSRAARVSNLLPSVAEGQSKGRKERQSGSVSHMMRTATAPAPKRPAAPKGLDAFLQRTEAPAAEQLARSQAARSSKRAKT